MTRPQPGTDFGEFYARYISNVTEDDVMAAIESQATQTQRLLASLDDARGAYRYAEGKWSVKQLLGHLTDSERIFGYRLLAISRGDTQPLPGWDEDPYVASAAFDSWRLTDLAEQYALLRRANLILLRNLPEEAWDRRGIASGHPVSVRAIAWILVGHERHHLNVLREKYQIAT